MTQSFTLQQNSAHTELQKSALEQPEEVSKKGFLSPGTNTLLTFEVQGEPHCKDSSFKITGVWL